MGAAGRTSVCCRPGSVRSAQEPEVWYLPEVKTTRKWKEERIYHNEPLWGKKKRKQVLCAWKWYFIDCAKNSSSPSMLACTGGGMKYFSWRSCVKVQNMAFCSAGRLPLNHCEAGVQESLLAPGRRHPMAAV